MPKPFLILTSALGACAILATAQEVPPPAALEKTPDASTPAREKISEEVKTPAPKTEERPGARLASKPGTTMPLLVPIETVAAPTPAPTPKPKPRSFFQRLFGIHPRRTARPAATPTPTPAATPRGHKGPHNPATTPPPDAVRTTPRPSPEKPAQPNPEPPIKLNKPAPPSKPEKPVTEPVVKPEKPAATPKPTPTPKASKLVATPPPIKKVAKPIIEPPADADPEVKEKYRFEKAKARAVEDPQVQSLKAKADDAVTEAESTKALRAYNKALFEKMRKVDGTLSERIDRMEAAILKRLNE